MSEPQADSLPADEATARDFLRELAQRHPLPEPFVLDQSFVEAVHVGGLPLYMVGLVASGGSMPITGSAAAVGGFPCARAHYELLERVSLFSARERGVPLRLREPDGSEGELVPHVQVFPADTAPQSFRHSLSNGVALHHDWAAATESALAELVERDHLLRSFRGGAEPRAVARITTDSATALAEHYELREYAFDGRFGSGGQGLSVMGVFGFPRRPEAPLFYGFGASRDSSRALLSAEREALQRLAFLWGEPIPSSPPAPAPTPDFHQEHYLVPAHHDVLRHWLDGGRARPSAAPPPPDEPPVRFADLTPVSLAGRLCVARALCEDARPLLFGFDPEGDQPHPHPVV